MDDRTQADIEATDAAQVDEAERQTEAAHEAFVREGRRRAAIWGVLTGLVMTVVALGCILLLYLALGR